MRAPCNRKLELTPSLPLTSSLAFVFRVLPFVLTLFLTSCPSPIRIEEGKEREMCVVVDKPIWKTVEFSRPEWCREEWNCYPDSVIAALFFYIHDLERWIDMAEKCK